MISKPNVSTYSPQAIVDTLDQCIRDVMYSKLFQYVNNKNAIFNCIFCREYKLDNIHLRNTVFYYFIMKAKVNSASPLNLINYYVHFTAACLNLFPLVLEGNYSLAWLLYINANNGNVYKKNIDASQMQCYNFL